MPDQKTIDRALELYKEHEQTTERWRDANGNDSTAVAKAESIRRELQELFQRHPFLYDYFKNEKAVIS
jgi:hypothetical protein